MLSSSVALPTASFSLPDVSSILFLTLSSPLMRLPSCCRRPPLPRRSHPSNTNRPSGSGARSFGEAVELLLEAELLRVAPQPAALGPPGTRVVQPDRRRRSWRGDPV